MMVITCLSCKSATELKVELVDIEVVDYRVVMVITGLL